jgi:hypothetical protein
VTPLVSALAYQDQVTILCDIHDVPPVVLVRAFDDVDDPLVRMLVLGERRSWCDVDAGLNCLASARAEIVPHIGALDAYGACAAGIVRTPAAMNAAAAMLRHPSF